MCIDTIQRKFNVCINNSLPRSCRQSNKNSSTGDCKPSFELLVRRVQETPQTLWTTTIALGCISDHENKSLWLKMSHTSD